MVDLTMQQDALYGVLRKEARMGRVCPGATVLAEMAGYSTQGSIQNAMLALQRKGLIHLEGGYKERVVMIIATGECTAKPELSSRTGRMAAVVHGAEPCFRCGSRPDACMCGRSG